MSKIYHTIIKNNELLQNSLTNMADIINTQLSQRVNRYIDLLKPLASRVF